MFYQITVQLPHTIYYIEYCNPPNPSNDGFQKNASRPEVPDTPSFTSSALLSDPFVLVRVFIFPIHVGAALVCHVFNFEETIKQIVLAGEVTFGRHL